MTLLSKEYYSLVSKKPKNGNPIPVIPIPKIKFHKIGVSELGLPVFFILCSDKGEKIIDKDLELIRVEFSRTCELDESGKRIQGLYTIISLKSNSIEIQNYFLDIVYLMLRNLPGNLKMKDLRNEISKLASLFSRMVEPPKKAIQGLWAELLVIDQSSQPDYLVGSWHVSSTEKYDFNDGTDKIEVKSTLKSRRIHSFALEQLNSNTNSKLIIASVLMTESGKGKNVFDLVSQIEVRLNSASSYKLRASIGDVLGEDFEKAQEVYFDYQLAVDSLSYYQSKDIPKLDTVSIPSQLTNIRFDSDLTDTKATSRRSVVSKLHKAAI